ncbi:hypothetical protein FHL15_009450 [Xylaria flabelliformis]|uniref:Uncharacterized protein n=1 Tax=Xylaria flabelliformis TaxID=2512241 RepID=A0A553HP43_9PEZI|nr:hypothetical protein FHL15_009450 [Xylaria flabelliformis]
MSPSTNNAPRLTASALVQHNNYLSATDAQKHSPELVPSGVRFLVLSDQSINDSRMLVERRKAWAMSQIKAFETAFYVGKDSQALDRVSGDGQLNDWILLQPSGKLTLTRPLLITLN